MKGKVSGFFMVVGRGLIVLICELLLSDYESRSSILDDFDALLSCCRAFDHSECGYLGFGSNFGSLRICFYKFKLVVDNCALLED